MKQFTESQLKLIDKICFRAGDLKTGAELGQFLIEDIEAIRKACDQLEKEMDTREWIPASEAMEVMRSTKPTRTSIHRSLAASGRGRGKNGATK